MKNFWYALVTILIFTVGMILATIFIIDPMKNAREHETWGQGYCAALGGEWLTAEVCNVDGKVVPIPEEER